MKFIFAFMSCFMLYLSFVPCSDGLDQAKYGHEVLVEPGDGNHSHQEESCTPLCVCSCCSVTIFTPATPPVLVFKVSHGSHDFPVFDHTRYSDALSNIWQPPRLFV